MFLAAPAASAQGNPPPSFVESGLLPLTAVDSNTMPSVTAAIAAVEQQFAGSDTLAIGIQSKAGFTTSNAGTWEVISGGGVYAPGQVWRLIVESPGALWVRPGFGTWRVPDGAMMWVYDLDLMQLTGPLTSADERDHGQLWTVPIDGSAAVVELYWPDELATVAPNIHLTLFAHGYRETAGWEDDCGAECSPDTSCDVGVDLSVIKRGWARFYPQLPVCTDQGTSIVGFQCSGSLVNTTAGDCRQYYLTAAHCIGHSGNLPGYHWLFNYERPACCSGVADDSDRIVGATLLAKWAGYPSDTPPESLDPTGCGPETGEGNDMALVSVDAEIPAAFDVRFNGWSRTAAPTPGALSIHMPTPGMSRKVSISTDGVIIDPDDSGFWQVDWEVGRTRGGSSGGALFNHALRIVGWLFGGGNVDCPGVSDEFGRLNIAWEGGGTEETRLKDWLDPLATNTLSISGRNDLPGNLCGAPPWTQVLNASLGRPIPGWGLGQRMPLFVTLANPGVDPLVDVEATITSLTAGVTVLQSSGTWPTIAGGAALEPSGGPFVVQVANSVRCSIELSFQLDITGTGGHGEWHPEFTVRLGRVAERTQDIISSFTSVSILGTNAFTLDSTDDTPLGPRWFVPAISSASETVLVTSPLTIPEHARLAFRHRFDTENTFDGGVLEYTTDGTLWLAAEPLIEEGGYQSGFNSSVAPDLLGCNGWGGDSTKEADCYRDVSVTLKQLSGKTVQFRWRFVTDGSTGDVGWWIDDAILESTTYDCGPWPRSAIKTP